ncbi:MAG: hypothetical protein WCD53_20770 [Microcoleus sp.]
MFSAVKSFRCNGQRYYIVDRCIGIVQTINSQQPTANSQQPTVNSQQSTVNSQQSTSPDGATGIDITNRSELMLLVQDA